MFKLWLLHEKLNTQRRVFPKKRFMLSLKALPCKLAIFSVRFVLPKLHDYEKLLISISTG
jgi:hypothetical protein